MSANDLPAGFLSRMQSLLGDSFPRFAKAMQEMPATAIRLNLRKNDAHPRWSGMTPVGWCDSGFYLEERPLFTLDPLLHAGAYYVQDPSSMIHQQIVARILRLPDMQERLTHADEMPLRVLDLCAAPGGKSTAIINALPDRSLMVSNEIDRQRCGILRENLEKWGYPEIIISNSDAASLGKAANIFDIIAVDAPCSGEGMMRKDADALTQWTPGLTESCARLQREILSDILPALRPGGYLIYSTCTFNTLENEENVKWLMEQWGMSAVALPMTGTETVLPSLDPDVPALRFMPHATRGEGLFAAILRMPGDELPAALPKLGDRKMAKGKKGRNATPVKGKTDKSRQPENPGEWLDMPHPPLIHEYGDKAFALSPQLAALDLLLRKNGVRVVEAGVPVAEIKGDLRLPAPELPLSLAFHKDAFPSVELSRDEALAYLRREPLTLPPSAPRGFITVNYLGLPLGLLKNIGSRTNNLYPQNWRIRTRRTE